jgi:gamma-glutamylcyclotransferase
MLSYFAYGSNLHPLRLIERVPSARLVGVVELRQYRLIFHKQSTDKSSKCNLIHTGSESDLIYGAIYEIDPAHKRDLDRVEGKGHGYIDTHMTLQHQGRDYTCFTYLAQQSYIVDHLKPYHWYKQLVILGARYLQFPDSYIHSIASVESLEDPNENRKKKHEKLTEHIINYSK